MGFFDLFAPPSPEQTCRRALRAKFISRRDHNEAWKTATSMAEAAALEKSTARARQMSTKYISQAEEAKKEREKEENKLFDFKEPEKKS